MQETISLLQLKLIINQLIYLLINKAEAKVYNLKTIKNGLLCPFCLFFCNKKQYNNKNISS